MPMNSSIVAQVRLKLLNYVNVTEHEAVIDKAY